MGILKGLMAGGRRCAFSSKSAASLSVKDEYALQSGKSDGKKGKPSCKKKRKNDKFQIYSLISLHSTRILTFGE